MELSDNRRQGDVLPSINYGGFERAQREGAQFHQRHPSIARGSISSASPISPTTMFGPSNAYPQPSSDGIHTPPGSRRTSNEMPGRQSLHSLPSLHEAIYEKPGGSFSAPQTPPIGPGSFSSAPPRNNSLPNTMPGTMPRSQPSDPGLHSHPPSQPQTPHVYPPPPPPSTHPSSHAPPLPHAQNHESSYVRHDSQSNGRSLQSNPYSQAPPPPAIPAMHPPETYAPPPPPPPPPPPSAALHHAPPTPYQSHGPYQHNFNQASTSPHYPPPPAASSFSNGPVSQPPPPPRSQYPPFGPPSHHQQPQVTPPPASQQQPPYQSHHQQPFSYPQSREGGYQSDSSGPTGQLKGVKRPTPSTYGNVIERALSISAVRRDMDTIKEHSARIYHIVDQYQALGPHVQQPHPDGLHAALAEFAEALQRSCRTTDALNNCSQVLQDLSNKEAEAKAHSMNASEYGTDDGHSYQDDNRSNGSQQPEKKLRRGRAAPPGRCHSCHRAETPEWRRGPDGARTLCNACGLHYAKLTRKLSKNTGHGTLSRKSSNSPLP